MPPSERVGSGLRGGAFGSASLVTGEIPQAAEQCLKDVLGRGRSRGADKRRDGKSGHEDAFDAAAQAALATDQQGEGPPSCTTPSRTIAQCLRRRAEM